ncbi:hypothetical protein N7501_003981 [Penicillium viridicatum]|nr:hypothetical protein N7501_003981 [Penicillium viridicatum]
MEQHDLLLIVDASNPRNCYISSLTALLTKIGVLAYRDYKADSLNQGQDESSQEPRPDLVAFAKRLRKNKRRSDGKAVKTALAKACEVMRADAKTLIFLYAETCPTASYS